MSVCVAMLFCALGDGLLLKQNKLAFAAGGMLAFATGHVFYILAMKSRFGFAAFGWQGAIACLCYLVYLFAAFMYLKKRVEIKVVLMGMPYLSFLCALSLCAFLSLRKGLDLTSALLFAGTLFFIVSDTVLCYEYSLDKHDGSVPVMSTYICAQILIALAFIL